jgi:hypothetical protein
VVSSIHPRAAYESPLRSAGKLGEILHDGTYDRLDDIEHVDDAVA